MENHDEIIGKRANYFLKQKQEVHLRCKNGNFRNGKINYVGADFLLIQDKFFKSDFPIFFLEIETIEPYVVQEKN